MGKEMRLRAGQAVGLVVWLALLSGTAYAQVSTNLPGSLLLFPKVINLGSAQDTFIQVTNTSNMPQNARCFYVDGSPDQFGRPRWQVTDFNLVLTRQQPTSWRASTGRPVNPADEFGGIDAGPVPPVPAGFTGLLLCVQVDSGFSPIAGNSLKGEATTGSVIPPSVSKYNAIGIRGLQTDANPATANQLLLNDIEYSGCPSGARVNLVQDGTEDAFISEVTGGSVVSTTITVVPCSMDLERLVPTRVEMFFQMFNEFEGLISTGTTIDCWGSFQVGNLVGNTGSLLYALIRADQAQNPQPFVGVANVLRADGNGNLSTAATNMLFFGNDPATNLDNAVIRLPRE
jgi:hypothetical protein